MKTNALKLIAVFTAFTFSSFAQTEIKLSKKLQKYAKKVATEFNQIPEERKNKLTEFAESILEKKRALNKVSITFVCTSNSRRSHLSQVWMQTAAIYYGIDSISTFSGGTEATEVNARAINALKRAGFTASRASSEFNSPYLLTPGAGAGNWTLFSKKYSDSQNPKSNFIAVMVCSEADKSCPMVPGAIARFGLPYDDPKYFDNTPAEQQKYDETCALIAREIFFVADYVKSKLIIESESSKK